LRALALAARQGLLAGVTSVGGSHHEVLVSCCELLVALNCALQQLRSHAAAERN